MAYLPDTSVDLLRALLVGQRAIESELRAQAQAIKALTAGVAPDAVAALVSAIFAVAGEREFRARELIGMAHRPGVPEAALRIELGSRNAVGVGLLLASAADQPCPDTRLVLTAVGGKPGRLGNTWRVSPTRTYANG